MRVIVTLLVGLAIGCLSLAAAASAAAPTEDLVTGTHQDGPTNPALTTAERIDVRSGPSGARPTGTITVFGFGADLPGGTATASTGPPTCLRVQGNRAAIGFDLHPVNPLPIASVVIFVEDNGVGQGVDRGSAVGSALPAPRTCPDPATASFQGDPTDVVVRDAVSLPTRFEQCRHGHWRDFGRFANRGRCLSFVARNRVCRALAKRHVHPPFCRRLAAAR